MSLNAAQLEMSRWTLWVSVFLLCSERWGEFSRAEVGRCSGLVQRSGWADHRPEEGGGRPWAGWACRCWRRTDFGSKAVKQKREFSALTRRRRLIVTVMLPQSESASWEQSDVISLPLLVENSRKHSQCQYLVSVPGAGQTPFSPLTGLKSKWAEKWRLFKHSFTPQIKQ